MMVAGSSKSEQKPDEEQVESISPQLSSTTTSDGSTREAPAPHEDYEGRHFHDPNATWTAREEAMIIHKTDLRLLGCLCLMYLGLQLDRSNLNNALTDHFLQDMGFNTTDYNNGLMIQRIFFLLAELPAQIFAMRFGYKNILPSLILTWGTVAWAQAWMQTRAAFFVTRAILGLCQGGFLPITILYLSSFYKSTELSMRLAVLGGSMHVSKALTSLIAAGLLRMRGVRNYPGWFWLFLVDGLLTLLIGFLTFFLLPASPIRTQGSFTKPWLTEREQMISVNRLLRDDPSKGQTATKARTGFRDLRETLTDPSIAMVWAIALLAFITPGPIIQYLTLTLRQLGFSTVQSNALTIPADLLKVIGMIALAWSTERFKDKTFHCIFAQFYCIPILATLLVLPPGGRSWARYSISTLLAGAPDCYPIVVSWLSTNTFDVKKRGLSIVVFSVVTQIGNVGTSQIYQEKDKPYYYTGNKVLISLSLVSILLFLGHRAVLMNLNRKKITTLDAMTELEKEEYTEGRGSTSGNKNLRFTFKY